MVRLSGRSRGCATCRKRRIKCDEALPTCKQCLRKGFTCPGAITDTFYVISSANHPTGKLSTAQSPEKRTPVISSVNPVAPCGRDAGSRTHEQLVTKIFCSHIYAPYSQTPEPNTSLQRETEDTVTAMLTHTSPVTLPSYYQPSRAEPFDQLYFSHFFDTYGHPVESIRACSWLAHLPRLMATTFTSKAMRYSCRATCMAFYGSLNGEASIRHEARNYYVAALRSQRAEVYGSRDGVSSTASQEGICTSVMMAYFEQVANNKGYAWEQHMKAACSMIEMRGPELCLDRFTYQLFRTVRLGMAYLSVAKNQTFVFSKKEWMEMTHESRRTPLDVMVDILLSLGPHMAAVENGAQGSYTKSGHNKEREARLTDLASLLTKASSPDLTDIYSTDSSYPLDDANGDPLLGCLRAMQDAIRLILSHLIYAICDESQRGEVYQAMLSYSAGVMTAVEAVDKCTRSHTSKMFITTLFPLKIMAAWSPSAVHRAWANERTGMSRVDEPNVVEIG